MQVQLGGLLEPSPTIVKVKSVSSVSLQFIYGPPDRRLLGPPTGVLRPTLALPLCNGRLVTLPTDFKDFYKEFELYVSLISHKSPIVLNLCRFTYF